jgi:CDP-diacylglycerol--serine O-phosphatidyltransferase
MPGFRRRNPVPGQKQRRIRRRLEAYRAARAGRVRRRLSPVAVPSFFTLMNLFSGFLSLIQTLEGNLQGAVWLIVLAGFFDVLDGMMARLTNGSSLFGTELDSLADIVSFGVAPAFAVYVFGLRDAGGLGLIVSSMPAVCGAVRLARFNIQFDGEKKDYFRGLPIPAQAAMLMVLMLTMHDNEWFARFGPSGMSILVPAVIVLSALMISTIRFDTIPRPSARYLRQHPRKAVLFGVALVLLVTLHQIGLLIVMAGYIVIGIGRAAVNLVRAIYAADPDAAPSES